MSKEISTPEVVESNNPTTADETSAIDALKKEIERLKDENQSLSERLKIAESDRDYYKRWWTEKGDEYDRLLALTKEMTKFAKLA